MNLIKSIHPVILLNPLILVNRDTDFNFYRSIVNNKVAAGTILNNFAFAVLENDFYFDQEYHFNFIINFLSTG
jgi:hypothetical protein